VHPLANVQVTEPCKLLKSQGGMFVSVHKIPFREVTPSLSVLFVAKCYPMELGVLANRIWQCNCSKSTCPLCEETKCRLSSVT
jgi:hypothetical protein